ncbi:MULTISPECIES: efflux RND transporter periplasmic adaptor subunit [unclassified Pseudoalteromonas]|uniref:efflux RND transporter periplasmic adaptor subunit n=1 Tax=unclassified Pseudoalteromonas TaxID=194690 RepID=UPI000CF62334|nr:MULTISPECIES: efflux RND transporter periplasmic adaptor subunit [unclassified Pseudoalteromonas]
MASKKQILLPIGVLGVSVALFAAFMAMKKPPEQKQQENIAPLVEVTPVNLTDVTMQVHSYGEVMAQEQTELVAQVSGQVVSIAEQFVKGGFVKQGDELIRIDPNDYEAALIEAQAGLAQAQSALEIEQAQAHVAKTEWQRIKDNANAVIPSELYLRKPQLAEKLAKFRAAQAQVKRAKRNLERTSIRAPYDALVTAKKISLGSVVNPGNVLGQIDATSIAKVRLPVANHDLQYLVDGGIGAKVTLTSEVAGKMRTWQGTIVRNEGVVDKRSRMTYLVAYVDAPYEQAQPLRFGAYTNASIVGKHVRDTAIVPSHLIKDNRIALIDNEIKLMFSDLEVIREQNGMAYVTAGLNSGQQVITSALEYPTQGMQLRLDEQEPKTAHTQLALKED